MSATMIKIAALAVFTCFAFTPWAKSQDVSKVDFAQDIEPIFRQNCVACHNSKKAEGGLNLESYDSLMKGGDSGAAITADNLDESYMLPRVTGEEEPWMPPDDNTVGAKRLTPAQVELMRAWIKAGAKASRIGEPASIQWGSLPENLRPVYAMATSPDGQHLAFGRGNSVTVTSISSAFQDDQQRSIDSLVDPALPSSSPGETGAGIAHLDIVQSIAFSPDSQRIATGGYRSIKIWKRNTSPQRILAGLAPADRIAAVAPSGKRIAYRAKQQGLVLVDLETGQAHRFLRVHATPITALVWTEDSAHLISCDESGLWLLTDADKYQTQEIVLPTNVVASSLVRLAEDRVIGLSSDGEIFELQLTQSPNSLSAFVRLLEHSQSVAAIAVSGDGSRLAVALADGKIQLRNLATWQVIREIDSANHIRSLTLNRDGSLLLAVPDSEAAKLWKTEDGSLLAELDRDYALAQQLQFASSNVSRQKMLIDLLAKELPVLEKAAEQEVEAQKKLVEARDKVAESLAAAKTARVNADSGLSAAQQAMAQAEEALAAAKKKVEEMVAQVQSSEKAVADAAEKQKKAEQDLSEREQALATAAQSVERAQAAIPGFKDRISSEQQRLTALESNFASLEAQIDHQPPIASAAFSIDDSQVILAGEDAAIRIFSVDGSPTANLFSPADTLTLTPSEDGTLTGLSADGTISAWDLHLGWQLERTIGDYQDSPISDRVTALDFSPDGKLLAAGSGPPSRYGDIKLFDVESGDIALDLGEAHSDTVFGLEFSPDGSLLASASADKLCRLFDVKSGAMLRAFEGHTHHVLDVSWHANGQTLATASADATIKLWKAETGEQIRTIEGFSKEVTALAFLSPTNEGEASQIVSASADGVVRLHDAESGKQIKAMNGTGDALYGVVAAYGNMEISAGGQGGKVWIWRLADAKLIGEIPPKSR